jgi:CRP-like cAMP-binding protein
MINAQKLQKYSMFGGFSPEEISVITPYMEEESYPLGADITIEGTPNDKVRFILEGRIRVTKRGHTLAEMGEGEEFGEMEVIDVMPSAATIKALEPTRVLSLSNMSLHAIHKSDPAVFAFLIMNLARDISRRLRKMDENAAPESPVNEWG